MSIFPSNWRNDTQWDLTHKRTLWICRSNDVLDDATLAQMDRICRGCQTSYGSTSRLSISPQSITMLIIASFQGMTSRILLLLYFLPFIKHIECQNFRFYRFKWTSSDKFHQNRTIKKVPFFGIISTGTYLNIWSSRLWETFNAK